MDATQQLFNAVAFGNIPLAQQALNNGADINARLVSNNQRTPLMFATMRLHFDMIRFLIDNGADVTLTDDEETSIEDFPILMGNFTNPDLITEIRDYLHQKLMLREQAQRNAPLYWQRIRDSIVHWRNQKNQAMLDFSPENQIDTILEESGKRKTRQNRKRMLDVIETTNKNLRKPRMPEFGKRKLCHNSARWSSEKTLKNEKDFLKNLIYGKGT